MTTKYQNVILEKRIFKRRLQIVGYVCSALMCKSDAFSDTELLPVTCMGLYNTQWANSFLLGERVAVALSHSNYKSIIARNSK